MQLFSYKKKKISRKWEKILFGIFFRIFTQARMPSCKVVDVLHKAFLQHFTPRETAAEKASGIAERFLCFSSLDGSGKQELAALLEQLAQRTL